MAKKKQTIEGKSKSIGRSMLDKAKVDHSKEIATAKGKTKLAPKAVTLDQVFEFFNGEKVTQLLNSLYDDALGAEKAADRTAAKKEIFDRLMGKAGSNSDKAANNIFGNVNITFKTMDDNGREEDAPEGDMAIEATIVGDEGSK